MNIGKNMKHCNLIKPYKNKKWIRKKLQTIYLYNSLQRANNNIYAQEKLYTSLKEDFNVK